MAKTSAPERARRVVAMKTGQYSLESMADEFNRRKSLQWTKQWKYQRQDDQHIYSFACGIKITCYSTTGSILVQGRMNDSHTEYFCKFLRQFLPPYAVFQVAD